MAMSNSERQRRFRARRDADTEKRKKYLQKGQERYKTECKSGKTKPIEQLSDREKRTIRKKWKLQKRNDRSREKEARVILNSIQTPPSSPEHEHAEIHKSSRQKEQQKKKKRREEAKSYRQKKKMQLEIDNLKRKVEMYKKRLTRKQQQENTQQPDTPRRRTRKMLRNFTPKDAKKSLFKCQVLIEAMREKYRVKRKKDKADFAKFLCSRTLKKYHLKTETYKSIGYSSPKKNRVRYQTVTKRLSEKVHAFYIRNDNSRLIPGKRQTKTLKKIRKQRRVLLFDLKTLHKKFVSEGKTKLSYSVFCRLRPFFVVFPRHSDRDTCMCKVCNNTELMAEALKRVSAIESANLNTCIAGVVCSTNTKECMYGDCTTCRGRSIDVKTDVLGNDIKWFEWNTKREVRTIKKGKDATEKVIHITVKELQTGKVTQLVDKFKDQLKRYSKHIYRTYNQYQYFAEKKNEIKEDECVLHVDFSENYVCGYGAEVQSVHFGASKRQITLHTGVAIVKDQPQYTFCTVSDSLVHGPEAVWAHLKPIVTEMKVKYPQITKLEIFSDGPVTQYKQKGNFYLASVKGKEYGFDDIKWSFFESGHGKGVPDAIGGAVKRRADNVLKYGGDITSAESFCTTLSEDSSIKMHLVKEVCIEKEKTKLNSIDLKPVPGTLNLHQVICDIKEGQIAHRHLSCHCNIGSEHKGHEYVKATIIEDAFKKKCVKGNITIAKDETNANIDHRSKKRTHKKNTNSESTRKSRRIQENSAETKSNGKEVNMNNTADENAGQHYNTNNNNEIRSQQTEDSSTQRKRKLCSTDKAQPKKRRQDVMNYEKILQNLELCQTFEELKQHLQTIPEIEASVKADEVNVYQNKLEVDIDSVVDIPDDLTMPAYVDDLYPVEVNTDGNCLPSCGSVYAFGNPDRPEEIRTRIIKELSENESYYLNNENLVKGSVIEINKTSKNMSFQYAQYSEYFVPGIHLTQTLVRDIFRKEILALTKNKSFMGIWQVFALSTILRSPIQSIYPMKGNTNVRNDLNRLICPRTETEPKSNPIYIMWTNTRDDIPTEHWVPNHFVPLLPFEYRHVRSKPNQDVHIIQDHVDRDDLIDNAEESLPTNEQNIEITVIVEEQERSTDEIDRVGSRHDNENEQNSDEREYSEKRNDELDSMTNNDINNNRLDTDLTYVQVQHTQSPEKECAKIVRGEIEPNIILLAHKSDNDHTIELNEEGAGKRSSTEDDPIKIDTETERQMNNNGPDNTQNNHHVDTAADDIQVNNGKVNEVISENENANVEQNNVNELHSDNNVSEMSKTEDKYFVPDIKECLNRYVIVNFNSKPYPGLVQEVHNEEVEVLCMHQVGRKKSSNCFFWPKKSKDLSWYDYDKIMTVIPEPAPIADSRNFVIDEKLFEHALHVCK